MEQGLMENECEESSELGFRRWIIRNFCELKEYVLNQCKETNNFEKRFDEMLTRMDNLEKNINELMELKNNTRNPRQKKLEGADWLSLPAFIFLLCCMLSALKQQTPSSSVLGLLDLHQWFARASRAFSHRLKTELSASLLLRFLQMIHCRTSSCDGMSQFSLINFLLIYIYPISSAPLEQPNTSTHAAGLMERSFFDSCGLILHDALEYTEEVVQQ
ncbi:LINE-1 retrotransposable element ORF1 protein, partial [Plecturocebus cupreus]